MEGLCWRIGNGWSVDVCSKKWISLHGKFTNPIPTHDNFVECKVGELISHKEKVWKVEVIHDLFESASAQAILAIPLSRYCNVDSLYWGHNKNGMYTVRSGYWLGMLGIQDNHRAATTIVGENVCKQVWKLNGPPKLKQFLWRACKNSLPVNEVRFHRHMAQSPLCMRCNTFNESICHAIFDCQQSNAMWLSHPSSGIIAAAPRSSFAECFLWLCENSDQSTFTIICASMWACWFGRNQSIMEDKQCDVGQLSASSVNMLHEYLGYSQNVFVGNAPTQPVPSSWRSPPEGWTKANFDAYVGADCTRGLGVAFRNHEGSLKVAAVRRLKSRMGVEETELTAACFALEVAIRMGYDNIVLEGDAQVVVNTIKRKDEGLSLVFAMYNDFHCLSSSFCGFSCSAIRRSGNTVAHSIARWETGVANERICMEPFPSGLLALTDLDLL